MGKSFTDEEREYYSTLIYKISKEMFINEKFKKTTISKIMSRVGIAKGSFYSFYPSKEALFFRLLLDVEKAKDESFYKKLKNQTVDKDFLEVLIVLLDKEIENLKMDSFLRLTLDRELMTAIWMNIDSNLQQESIDHDKAKMERQLERATSCGYKINCTLDVYTEIIRTLVFTFLDGIMSENIEAEVRKKIITGVIKEVFEPAL